MKAEELDLQDENEELEKLSIKMLSRYVLPYLSNLVIFNLAYFCVGLQNYADEQFREVLNHELFRRRVLRVPHFSTGNVNVRMFTKDERDSIDIWFACDPAEATSEDHYVRLFTGRDRWTERNTPKRKRRTANEVT